VPSDVDGPERGTRHVEIMLVWLVLSAWSLATAWLLSVWALRGARRAARRTVRDLPHVG